MGDETGEIQETTEVMLDGMTEMPAVDEAVIATATEDAARVDVDGTPFDPDVHATDRHGQPKTRKSGRWEKRRNRGAEASRAECRALGKLAAGTIIGACSAAMGPEWQ